MTYYTVTTSALSRGQVVRSAPEAPEFYSHHHRVSGQEEGTLLSIVPLHNYIK